MNGSEAEKRRRAVRTERASTIFASVACVLVLGATLALAVKMVIAGRGLETHRSFWLVEDSWLGLLVTMALCLVAVIGGVVWRAVQRRREERQWLRHDAKWRGTRRPDAWASSRPDADRRERPLPSKVEATPALSAMLWDHSVSRGLNGQRRTCRVQDFWNPRARGRSETATAQTSMERLNMLRITGRLAYDASTGRWTTAAV